MPTKKNIQTPELLYKHFEKYKEYCKENPKYEYAFIPSMKKEVGITREIPYTWDGFEIWLRKEKILVRLDDYKTNKDGRYTAYADIIHAIRQEINEDKYTGAVAGVFNANIIAYDLGLKKKEEEASKPQKIVFDFGSSGLTTKEFKNESDV